MNIGDKLKDLRLQREMTLEDLSRKSEVSKSLLSQVERNISVPTVITLERITRALGIATSELFFELENSDKSVSSQASKDAPFWSMWTSAVASEWQTEQVPAFGDCRLLSVRSKESAPLFTLVDKMPLPSSMG